MDTDSCSFGFMTFQGKTSTLSFPHFYTNKTYNFYTLKFDNSTTVVAMVTTLTRNLGNIKPYDRKKIQVDCF